MRAKKIMDNKLSDKTEGEKSIKKKDFPLLNFNHIKRFSIVISITLIIVLGLVALGYWLDKKFDTKPWFLLIGLIISFPIAQITVYKKMKQFMNKEFKRLNVKTKK